MPRPRRQSSGTLSPGQAQYVLDRLLRDRRVTSSDVDRYVADMNSEISELEQRLHRLKEAAGPALAAVAGIAAGAAGAAVVRRARRGRPPGRRGPGRPPGRPRAAESTAPEGGEPKRGRRRRSKITPEQLASRQLQGRYLALVRRFTAGRRAYYAKVAKDRGRESAIKEMQQELGKK